ncbi:MAG: hypothetical protein ACJAW3_001181 [Lentimonas sp.]|jgi:uncharacterized protein with NRDE domain
MCSLTIEKQENGQVLITMNRDERIILKENLPEIFQYPDTKIITPIDQASNGSWVGVNDFGVCVCLLNRYETYNSANKSRGEIFLKTLQLGSFSEIGKFLENDFQFQSYNPFTLVVIFQDQIIKFDFDGSSKSIKKSTLNTSFFATSSSWKWNEVLQFRREIFEEWQVKPTYKSGIPTHHLPIPNQDSHWTSFVERGKIHTKNICQISLENKLVSFKYWSFDQITNQQNSLNCAPLKLKIQ